MNKSLLLLLGLTISLASCRDNDPDDCTGISNIDQLVEVFANGQTDCYLEGVEYTVYVPFGTHLSYQWSTGANTSQITVSEPGVYGCTVTDVQNNSETFYEVSILDDCGLVYVPNAFTPNGDGLNESFAPVGRNICQYRMWVSDLDGITLFETEDLLKGWDGRSDDKPMDAGMYVWNYEITFVNGDYQENTGFLELLR